MELPFKIIVDSRTLVRGHASDFEVTLPETLHLDQDAVMYVNSASVTNTFFSNRDSDWGKKPLRLLVREAGHECGV